MDFDVVKTNGAPNSPDLKELIVKQESAISSLPTNIANGSIAYLKDLSKFWVLFDGVWTEAGV